MKLFEKTVNSWKPFTIFSKSSILCVWLGSAYASGIIVLFKCSNFHSKLFLFDTQCMLVSPLNSHISEDFNFEDFQRHVSHALRPIWPYRAMKYYKIKNIIKMMTSYIYIYIYIYISVTHPEFFWAERLHLGVPPPLFRHHGWWKNFKPCASRCFKNALLGCACS